MNLLDMLSYDDLDETQRELADCIGFEAYKKLIAGYSGENITVRMPKGLTLKIRNDLIRSEYNGGNIRELGHKYGLSERTVRSLVSDLRTEKQNAPLPDQIGFWENNGDFTR